MAHTRARWKFRNVWRIMSMRSFTGKSSFDSCVLPVVRRKRFVCVGAPDAPGTASSCETAVGCCELPAIEGAAVPLVLVPPGRTDEGVVPSTGGPVPPDCEPVCNSLVTVIAGVMPIDGGAFPCAGAAPAACGPATPTEPTAEGCWPAVCCC